MEKNYDIKLAVSLYSYQDNYYFKRYDLEGCIAAAAGSGAEGFEVVARKKASNYKRGIVYVRQRRKTHQRNHLTKPRG